MNRGAYELQKFFRSQTEEAPLLGIEPSTLSLLLSGKRKPSIEVAAVIERRFGVPCCAWVDEFWNPPPAADAVEVETK